MRVSRIYPSINRKSNIQVDISLLDPLLQKYKGIKGNLIPLLQGTQEIYGFIPRSAFERISDETGLPLSKMYGVATFYAQFRLHPVGKHIIKVCHGTACHVQNANLISEAIEEELCVKDGETTEDHFYTLESVACLGCCSLAPVMMVGDHAYGKLTGTKATRILKEIRDNENK
ncbi:MAG: NADH-quinone oxidoreductase subunit NuoE [Bacteroidota bacterium]|nr:NADH-quinone oxidoreductase subunit NuoE [Bacteroidota bacterium]